VLVYYQIMFAVDILPGSMLSVSMEAPKTSAAANTRSEESFVSYYIQCILAIFQPSLLFAFLTFNIF